MRILGKVLVWVMAGILATLSISAFMGMSFAPETLGTDFIIMAAIMAETALTQFKKPHPIFRKFVVRYDDGTVERHAGPANEKWGFSTAEGKRVICIDVSDIKGMEGDDGKQD